MSNSEKTERALCWALDEELHSQIIDEPVQHSRTVNRAMINIIIYT